MRLRSVWVSFLGLVVAASAAACGGGSEPASTSPASSSAPAGQKVDPATAGDVTGLVVLEGVAPKNEPIKMNADPTCLKQAPAPQLQETFVVGPDGKGLGNVFVYVKDGLGNYVYDPPTTTAIIDQQGCRYRPHVLGVRVGQ